MTRARPANRSRYPLSSTGIPVDVDGGPTIDPTKNVNDLVESAITRIDDLRDASDRFNTAETAHIKEVSDLRALHESIIGKLREEYQEKVQHAESGRLDSIRQVDREEVAKTAVAANTAITTLAKQTNDLAVTLAKTVADTAAAAEARNSAQYSDTNKRLSALELSSSEGKGKQTLSDPQMERLTALVEGQRLTMEALARNQSQGAGKSEGSATMWGYVVGAIGLIGVLLAIGSAVVGVVVWMVSRGVVR